MKKLGLLALFLILPMLFACGETEKGENEEPMSDGFKMTALVTALGEKIEVNVTESEYATGPFWIITSSNTAFLDKNGEKISKSDIKVGDAVEIVYNGQMMMSLPPQVVAREIRKI
jgi:hypothetical protein